MNGSNSDYDVNAYEEEDDLPYKGLGTHPDYWKVVPLHLQTVRFDFDHYIESFRFRYKPSLNRQAEFAYRYSDKDRPDKRHLSSSSDPTKFAKIDADSAKSMRPVKVAYQADNARPNSDIMNDLYQQSANRHYRGRPSRRAAKRQKLHHQQQQQQKQQQQQEGHFRRPQRMMVREQIDAARRELQQKEEMLEQSRSEYEERVYGRRLSDAERAVIAAGSSPAAVAALHASSSASSSSSSVPRLANSSGQLAICAPVATGASEAAAAAEEEEEEDDREYNEDLQQRVLGVGSTYSTQVPSQPFVPAVAAAAAAHEDELHASAVSDPKRLGVTYQGASVLPQLSEQMEDEKQGESEKGAKSKVKRDLKPLSRKRKREKDDEDKEAQHGGESKREPEERDNEDEADTEMKSKDARSADSFDFTSSDGRFGFSYLDRRLIDMRKAAQRAHHGFADPTNLKLNAIFAGSLELSPEAIALLETSINDHLLGDADELPTAEQEQYASRAVQTCIDDYMASCPILGVEQQSESSAADMPALERQPLMLQAPQEDSQPPQLDSMPKLETNTAGQLQANSSGNGFMHNGNDLSRARKESKRSTRESMASSSSSSSEANGVERKTSDSAAVRNGLSASLSSSPSSSKSPPTSSSSSPNATAPSKRKLVKLSSLPSSNAHSNGASSASASVSSLSTANSALSSSSWSSSSKAAANGKPAPTAGAATQKSQSFIAASASSSKAAPRPRQLREQPALASARITRNSSAKELLVGLDRSAK